MMGPRPRLERASSKVGEGHVQAGKALSNVGLGLGGITTVSYASIYETRSLKSSAMASCHRFYDNLRSMFFRSQSLSGILAHVFARNNISHLVQAKLGRTGK